MERGQAAKFLSHVLLSYTSRELDRKWIDVFMGTDIGQRLKSLNPSQQHAFEFVSYLLTAWLVHNNPNPSAFRSYLNGLLTDLPTEIVKRMMESKADPGQIDAVLLDVNDDDLASVMAAVKANARAEHKSRSAPDAERATWMGELASGLERKRAELRKREWREKK